MTPETLFPFLLVLLAMPFLMDSLNIQKHREAPFTEATAAFLALYFGLIIWFVVWSA